MIGETILYYKIPEKLGKARPAWHGQAETGRNRQNKKTENL